MKSTVLAFTSAALLLSVVSAKATTNEELLKENQALREEIAALRAKSQTHSSKINRNSNSAFPTATLPIIKSEPVAAPIPLWQGFYAGLNAGYGWGTNSNTTSSLSSAGSGAPLVYGEYNFGQPSFLGGGLGAAPQGMTQSGFIGGAQFGYNYQYGQNILVGFETDIHGTGLRGGSSGSGVYGGNGSGVIRDPQTGEVLQDYTARVNQTGYNINTVSAGLDFLGTARVRIGYLYAPNMLIYGTGGFAYGGAWANVSRSGVSTINADIVDNSTGASAVGCPEFCPGVEQPWNGSARGNALLVGYSAGAGVEWMFIPNWSLKGEAIYYNLGNINVANTAVASPAYGSFPGNTAQVQAFAGSSIIGGNTSVNYQGVIARLGVNYHVNFGATPVVAKF